MLFDMVDVHSAVQFFFYFFFYSFLQSDTIIIFILLLSFSLSLDPSDPQWVGAWWIGVLVALLGLLLILFPICGYPKHLPGHIFYLQVL